MILTALEIHCVYDIFNALNNLKANIILVCHHLIIHTHMRAVYLDSRHCILNFLLKRLEAGRVSVKKIKTENLFYYFATK